MFSSLGNIPPPGILSPPTNVPVDRAGMVLPEPLAFTKPFPAKFQQWDSFEPRGTIVSTTPQGGWPGPQLDNFFIKRLSASLQIFDAQPPYAGNAPPLQWRPVNPETFIKRFPVCTHLFFGGAGNPSIPSWFS